MNTNWNDPNFQGFRGQNPFHREGHTPKPRKAVGTPFGRTVLNLAVTLWVRDALKTMDIRLLDHIIVADNDFVSMNQSGYLL